MSRWVQIAIRTTIRRNLLFSRRFLTTDNADGTDKKNPRNPRNPWLIPILVAALPRWVLPGLILLCAPVHAQLLGRREPPTHQVVLLDFAGLVEVSESGSQRWRPLQHTNHLFATGDRGHTARRSRALLQLSDLTLMRLGETTEFLIEPVTVATQTVTYSFLKGLAAIFHRDRPGMARFRSKTATAATRGTEFYLEVEESGRMTLTVLEGEAELTSAGVSTSLVSGEQGLAEPGQPPRKTAVLQTINVIQWCLYYPGVLDLDELPLTAAEQQMLSASMAAYRQGDLLAALAQYPAGRDPVSAQEKVYLAALLLAIGQVDGAERLLDSLAAAGIPETRTPELALALRTLIAAVKLRPRPPGVTTALATSLLADSYYHQSLGNLTNALRAARQAMVQSPHFGFAAARVAELEFSHGRTRAAQTALQRSLALAPRNAQARALKGFLLAAENDFSAAIGAFGDAIAIDGALGNAWLGRGLCRIRQGNAHAGRLDLEVAATLEPQRSLFRSYLGKGWSQEADDRRAARELELARSLDAKDPTPWLYSALLLQQHNQINEAVRALEASQQLNDNRRLYRSKLLLDQDRAVRGANLANIFREAGMMDQSVREAARAVNTDYANFSAHQFLADSYNELRDPNLINQRYETAWLSEFLVANLLAPVGARPLRKPSRSRSIPACSSATGSASPPLRNISAVGTGTRRLSSTGLLGRSSYAAELFYHSRDGTRPNNDLEQLALNLRLKHELTARDGLFFQGGYYHAEGGDVFPYYRPEFANPGLRTRESQEGTLLAGYHHEWRPGVHTLLLAGRLPDTFQVANPFHETLYLGFGDTVSPVFFQQHHRSETEFYTAEAQQIWQWGNHASVFGGRFQTGTFAVSDDLEDGVLASTNGQPGTVPFPFPVTQTERLGFERRTAYGYHQYRPWEPLLLVAGLTYDWLTFPENFLYAPIAPGETTVDQWSPKGGFIWTPTRHTVVRAAYTRALGGVSFDQSFQLEPSQVAGFNQAFRSLIPEAAAGANVAPTFTSVAASLEQKVGRGTYLSLSAEWLESEVERNFGVYRLDPTLAIGPSTTRQRLDFQERSLSFTAHQLLSDEWSVGLRYRLSDAELDTRFVELVSFTPLTNFKAERRVQSTLHQLNLLVNYNHPSGFFAQAEALWWAQSNDGYTPARPGDDFWQGNVYAGYRFPRRRAELRLGLLNLTDRDYQINPLNLTVELPRQRTVAVSLKLNF